MPYACFLNQVSKRADIYMINHLVYEDRQLSLRALGYITKYKQLLN